MINNTRLFYQISTLLGIAILISIITPSQVAAQGIVQGENLPNGTVITGDAVFYGNSVNVDGDIDGDVFAIANEIEINGRVSGSLVLFGNKVTVNSEVGGTLYVAAMQLDLATNAVLSRNVYFGGLSLSTQEGSQIHRDLYTATLGAQMNGSVDGEIQAIIGPAEFFFLMMEKIDQQNQLNLKPAAITVATISNQGTNNNEPKVMLAGFAPALSLEAISLQQLEGLTWENVGDWLLERFQDWLVLLVFGLLGLWLMPKWVRGSVQFLISKPLPSAGWGLLGFVISFNLIGVVILALIIIIIIGLFLGTIAFWELAWSFMAFGGFSLGVISTSFTLFVIYISKAIVAVWVGGKILDRIAPSHAGDYPLALITGLALYVLLAGVPILGWVIGIFATVFGLGAVWLFYKDRRVQARKLEPGITSEMTTV